MWRNFRRSLPFVLYGAVGLGIGAAAVYELVVSLLCDIVRFVYYCARRSEFVTETEWDLWVLWFRTIFAIIATLGGVGFLASLLRKREGGMDLMGIVLGVGFFSAFVLSCWLTVLGSMHIFSLWDRLSGPVMLSDLLSYPIILVIAVGLSLVSAGCIVLIEYFGDELRGDKSSREGDEELPAQQPTSGYTGCCALCPRCVVG